jgi:hypothetical protein
MVDLLQAARDALRFFDRTEHQYTRFNYIGEWHSHPSFEIKPSPTDVRTMVALLTDPMFRGSFAIMMIARLAMATSSRQVRGFSIRRAPASIRSGDQLWALETQHQL